MKVLINYIRTPTGHKQINKYSTMKLNESDNSVWEIVEVEETTELTKIEFDDDNNIVVDIEKHNMKKQLELLAEELVNKEFEQLIGEM